MSYAKLLTDLDHLQEGDVFYIHVYREKLAYMVDQIRVVLPTDTSDLQIVKGEDYVTLITCTPYGVNSHRLLVRGTRISEEEAEEERTVPNEETQQDTQPVSSWQREYLKYIAMGIALSVVLLLAVVVIGKRR